MNNLYTIQCCSTTSEVITTALILQALELPSRVSRASAATNWFTLLSYLSKGLTPCQYKCTYEQRAMQRSACSGIQIHSTADALPNSLRLQIHRSNQSRALTNTPW